jgi:biopolymer transport protein ExbB/TolQ
VEESVFATVALPIALAVIMTVLGLALTRPTSDGWSSFRAAWRSGCRI